MKKGVVTVFCGVVIYAAFAISCMDRTPAPVCPVPTEINQTVFAATGFNGVDLLVVVDNSASMALEQQILATGFFTLINSLVNPQEGWEYPPVDNLRVAVVSSDMGLQWGEEGSLEDSPQDITECLGLGDDGKFYPPQPGQITVASGVIGCDPGGGHCPCESNPERSGCAGSDWTCTGGFCASASGQLNCPDTVWGLAEWAENEEGDNLDIAREVACMSNLGIEGCAIEQQLEASVKGLATHRDFMVQDHLLAVLVVSDEEDCSVATSDLFKSEEWNASLSEWINVACGWEKGEGEDLGQPNDDKYLFSTGRYRTEWTTLKGGVQGGVVFAAIVGVPRTDACQGAGSELTSCLEETEMQYSIRQPEDSDRKYFDYACERGTETQAAPGRRYVKVAQDLGDNGYIYSICNADWSPAMKEVAQLIAVAVGASCYPDSLVWVPLSVEDQEAEECTGCGVAVCNMVYEYDFLCNEEEELSACEERLLADDATKCPDEFKDQGDERQYEMKEDTYTRKLVLDCIVPKLEAPFNCSGTNGADARYEDTTEFGWYYCENLDCSDGEDPEGQSCCQYGINFTAPAEEASAGHSVKIQCLQEFTFEDVNCQENSARSCNDNIDNDGNGVWDCNNEMAGENPHRADRNCCSVDYSNCEIDPISYGEGGICPDNSITPDHDNHSDACKIQVLRCCLQEFDGGLPDICQKIKDALIPPE